MGEMEGSDTNDRFFSYWDPNTGMTHDELEFVLPCFRGEGHGYGVGSLRLLLRCD